MVSARLRTPGFARAAREWDWRETRIRHMPGIQPADVPELLEHGAAMMVLSKGVLERLQVCPETLALLGHRGVPAHVLPTEAAVRLYNELAATQQVGGVFHSTCWSRPRSVRASFDAGARPALCFVEQSRRPVGGHDRGTTDASSGKVLRRRCAPLEARRTPS
jgi:hypothetical protein